MKKEICKWCGGGGELLTDVGLDDTCYLRIEPCPMCRGMGFNELRTNDNKTNAAKNYRAALRAAIEVLDAAVERFNKKHGKDNATIKLGEKSNGKRFSKNRRTNKRPSKPNKKNGRKRRK